MIKMRVYAVCFLIFISSAITSAAPGPTEQIKITIDAVLGTLKDHSLNKLEKRERLLNLIKSQFDFRTMSQAALATYWRKASAEEQKRFTELFSELLEWTYIGRIEAYTNEKVEYTGEKLRKVRAKEIAVVATKIVTANAEIPIIYELIKREDKWLVYNVLVENVNLVRNYRDSYRSIVKKEGINGLLTKMEQKVKELKSRS
jgi:phospholipid transport system substrate-binding protein